MYRLRLRVLGPFACALLSAAWGSKEAPPGGTTTLPPSGGDASVDSGEPLVDGSIEDVAWDHVRVPYDAGGTPVTARTPVVSELLTTRVDTEALLFAAGEMQI